MPNDKYIFDSRYEVAGVLGRGGYGVVFKAFDTKSKRDVAIKLLLPEHLDDPKVYQRLIQEIKILLNINPPHIVPIYELSQVCDRAYDYFVMPYYKGGSLKQRLTVFKADRRLPSLSTTVTLVSKVAYSLQKLHTYEKGGENDPIIHRDLKPSNIMIHNGEPYVIDFGIARRTHSTTQDLTGTSGQPGTHKYVAVEQRFDEMPNYNFDLFPLAVIAYEMLTGVYPYRYQNSSVVYFDEDEVRAGPKWIGWEASNRHLPDTLKSVFERALTAYHPNPYSSIQAFADAFEEAIAQHVQTEEQDDFFTFRLPPTTLLPLKQEEIDTYIHCGQILQPPPRPWWQAALLASAILPILVGLVLAGVLLLGMNGNDAPGASGPTDTAETRQVPTSDSDTPDPEPSPTAAFTSTANVTAVPTETIPPPPATSTIAPSETVLAVTATSQATASDILSPTPALSPESSAVMISVRSCEDMLDTGLLDDEIDHWVNECRSTYDYVINLNNEAGTRVERFDPENERHLEADHVRLVLIPCTEEAIEEEWSCEPFFIFDQTVTETQWSLARDEDVINSTPTPLVRSVSSIADDCETFGLSASPPTLEQKSYIQDEWGKLVPVDPVEHPDRQSGQDSRREFRCIIPDIDKIIVSE